MTEDNEGRTKEKLTATDKKYSKRNQNKFSCKQSRSSVTSNTHSSLGHSSWPASWSSLIWTPGLPTCSSAYSSVQQLINNVWNLPGQRIRFSQNISIVSPILLREPEEYCRNCAGISLKFSVCIWIFSLWAPWLKYIFAASQQLHATF